MVPSCSKEMEDCSISDGDPMTSGQPYSSLAMNERERESVCVCVWCVCGHNPLVRLLNTKTC